MSLVRQSKLYNIFMEMMTCVDLASSIASYDDSIIIVHTVPVSGTLWLVTLILI